MFKATESPVAFGHRTASAGRNPHFDKTHTYQRHDNTGNQRRNDFTGIFQ